LPVRVQEFGRYEPVARCANRAGAPAQDPRLLEEFLRVADNNTRANLETCAILAGRLTEGAFMVTTLLIPKQESTSDTCSTLDEEVRAFVS